MCAQAERLMYVRSGPSGPRSSQVCFSDKSRCQAHATVVVRAFEDSHKLARSQGLGYSGGAICPSFIRPPLSKVLERGRDRAGPVVPPTLLE